MNSKKDFLYQSVLNTLKNSPDRAWYDHEVAAKLQVSVRKARKTLWKIAQERKAAIVWSIYKQCGYKYIAD